MPKVVLNEYKEKAFKEKAIEIELSDGSSVFMLPMQLWDDSFRDVATSENGDKELCVRLLGGEDNYKRFIDNGGTSMILMSLLAEHMGTDLPKLLQSMASLPNMGLS